ncbi:Mot1p [Sugiyamaella lignohabitans]|uniref:TATA-binding protein-associated factor mot1 n=1 Tax=Sugiyamaella lignohabitans TaxID=796027 RepID=A0A167CWC1_9ASCO|nr:Mot1p [Sugiyamaella lignohabitans]ANB12181.1 Mot1p [Sugiyamaella lignohabitans]
MEDEKPVVKSEGGSEDTSAEGLLSFANLDIKMVIKFGGKLVGSAGKEYDDPTQNLDPVERLKRQKQNLKQKLGMAGEYLDDEILNDSDIKPTASGNGTGRNTASKSSSPVPAGNGNGATGVKNEPTPVSATPTTPGTPGTPSTPAPDAASAAQNARLRAMAKRRAKFDAKNSANKVRVVDLSASQAAKRLAKDQTVANSNGGADNNGNGNGSINGSDFEITAQGHNDKVVVEHKAPKVSPLVSMQQESAGKVWPFEGLCELLMVDLFDECWEVRHGAVLGLREVIRVHGKGAGRVKGVSRQENDRRNSQWLEDLSCRLCCIFALDRFGDYVSDQVVAPVRESAAQALAALLLHLPNDIIYSTFLVLCQLILQKDLGLSFPLWEACHGGMLGLRYLVSVRVDILAPENEHSTKYFDGIVDCVLHGLQESDDDVQAMAAATLLPIASEFVAQRPGTISELLEVIWECLAELRDDLSAAIGNVMDLLAKLCGFPVVLDTIRNSWLEEESQSFSSLVPRLYPFLRHSITNVRKSVLRALQTFLTIEGEGSKEWIDGRILRLIFQNLLVEQNKDVLNLSLDVWNMLLDEIVKKSPTLFSQLFNEHFSPLLTLLMTPIGTARHFYKMNSSLFIKPSGASYSPIAQETNGEDKKTPKQRGRKRKASAVSESPIKKDSSLHVNIDNPMFLGDVTLVEYSTFLRTKVTASRALGRALSLWDSQQLLALKGTFDEYINSPFSTQRLVAALIIEEYGIASTTNGSSNSLDPEFSEYFREKFTSVLGTPSSEGPMYRDLTPYLRAVRTQCQALFSVFVDTARLSRSKLPQVAVVVQGEPEAGPDAFNIATAEKISGETFEKLKRALSTSSRIIASQALSDAHRNLVHSIDEAKDIKSARDISINAASAAAFVALSNGTLPKKLNPFIQSLMGSIKSEADELLQGRTAKSISDLISLFLRVGKTGAADKVVKNLCVFLCVDTSEVPEFHHNAKYDDSILSLIKEETKTEIADLLAHQKEVKAAKIKRLGAKTALHNLSLLFGVNLFQSVPKLKECMFGALSYLKEPDSLPAEITQVGNTVGQDIIDSLSVIKALLPSLDKNLHGEFLPHIPLILNTLSSKFSVLRYTAAKCFATICSVITVDGINALVETVLPMVSNALSLFSRQGAIECIYHLTSTMGVDILPYVVFLIVPVLGRMSDADKDIRLIATTTFASIIKLVPLESGIPDPPGMSAKLLEGRDREREFISQMMDVSKIQKFNMPVAIKADLRKYQQDGVNWLAFLNKYHLHGILCDDMGLGKTLQTICIVASDHHLRAEEHARTGSDESRSLPSLVICPPSLTGHWKHEINTYAPFLKVQIYVGSPSYRSFISNQFNAHDVVVTSYDISRNDVAVISKQNWNYCVLDEGHIIKNASSKLTKAVKTFNANHRLILSGTPIQNNVLELWSLFDFLMPGFLGTEKVFNERFAKPISASRNAKSSSKEQEAGALALEALHKQVLPFLLRRLKEDVLSDLPPKIIQDYYCDLSDLQKQLYDTFVKSQRQMVASEAGDSGKEGKQHIFQALQYMRKLCNHPALVVNEKHPQYAKITAELAFQRKNIRDISHAPKLMALQELLIDCGIGATGAVSATSTQQQQAATLAEGVTSQHRALIFCQLKDMLNMVENDLFKKHMPSVSYMRLDGSTDARHRQDIVQKFNSDPSIDVLLLTTHVGGLGLNLTGADTVIFVEHDWNPMNDLQAMDRAHRIGQKKVVNVYRLITKNTLEEKIMGLQKFKLNIASTIINQQNSGLSSMGTDQILDLFSVSDTNKEEEQGSKPEEALDETGQIKNRLAPPNAVSELGELWDEKEYEEEYNLDSFIQNLRG